MARTTRYEDTSSFPNSIDELILVADLPLKYSSEDTTYRNLISNNRYSDAGTYLEEIANMHSMCASLFNLIENRIYATQEYLLNKKTKWYDEYGVNSPFAYGEEPTDKEKTPVWIEE